MKKCIMAMIVGLVMVAFNNFDYFKWNHFEMASVNEASRISHAKELLGKQYRGSLAQRLEGSSSLNVSIYNKVQNNLRGKWKAQAQKISQTIIAESNKNEFDPIFVMAVIETESKFNPLAHGRFGEIGLMQLKPDTAAWIASKYGIPWRGAKSLENPLVNIRLGIAYMSHLRDQFAGASNKYVTAYNMGPRNVRRLFASKIRPKEYATRVMGNYKKFYTTMAAQNSPTVVADLTM